MAVSTMTAPEVEPHRRLTKWLIGAASVVNPLPQAEKVA
jgi:hypothetical protein